MLQCVALRSKVVQGGAASRVHGVEVEEMIHILRKDTTYRIFSETCTTICSNPEDRQIRPKKPTYVKMCRERHLHVSIDTHKVD